MARLARALRYAVQGLLYAAFMAVVGYLTLAPAHSPMPGDHAKVTLTFAHTPARKGECRELTPEERAELPPTRRIEEECPRERVPIAVEVHVDGSLLYSAEVPPSGWRRDGRAYVYERFELPAGEYALTLKMADQYPRNGFDVVQERQLSLAAGQSVVIDYSRHAGGFVLRHVNGDGVGDRGAGR